MSFLKKQQEWTDYLNAIIANQNPFLSDTEKKEEDNILTLGPAPATNETVHKELEAAKGEAERVFGEMEETGGASISRGEAESERALAQSSVLYELLRGFTAKQESRYDRLLEKIEKGDYLASDAAKAIVDSYTARGREAAGHAAAEAAAANGGNPDTYAAAQANRQRLAFEEAGQAAAREYYGEHLDRMLATLRASSADLGDLYAGLQDNVDGTASRAKDNLSIGADLLKALSEAQERSKKSTLDTLLTLAEKNEKYNAVSPMEVDSVYQLLLNEKIDGKARYTPKAALAVLWKRFPTMRDYIIKKYNAIYHPDYAFDG